MKLSFPALIWSTDADNVSVAVTLDGVTIRITPVQYRQFVDYRIEHSNQQYSYVCGLQENVTSLLDAKKYAERKHSDYLRVRYEASCRITELIEGFYGVMGLSRGTT